MILLVGGIKGGSGKTTLAVNLAVCRFSQNKKVLLIDADEQGSSSDWHQLRKKKSNQESLELHKIYGSQLIQFIEKNENQFDDIIIDCGGRDTMSQRAAMVTCDAFLAPLRPRSLDIWTIVSLRKMSSEIHGINKNFKIMAVLNQCDSRGTDNETAKKIVKDEGIFCLDVEIGYRKAFSNSVSEGLSVIEYPKSDKKSVFELLTLHDNIYKTNMLDIYFKNG